MIFRKRKHLLIAQEAIECGDLESAIVEFENYLHKKPSDIQTRRKVARLYEQVDRPKGAVGHYQLIIEDLRSSGLALKAESVCRAILKIDDESSWALATLAELSDIREAVVDSAAIWQQEDGIIDVDDEAITLDDDNAGFEVLDTATVAPKAADEIELDLDLDSDALIGEADENQQVHADLLATLPIFSELPKAAFLELMAGLSLWHTPKDGVLVRVGERGESIFVIVSGRVKVIRSGRTVAHLTDGSIFGEMAYLSGLERGSTIIAETESQVLEVSSETLDSIRDAHPGADKALHQFFRARMIQNVLDAPIFRDLDEDIQRDIMRGFRTVKREAGDAILHEGKATDALYVVLGGRLRVTQHNTILAELSEGDVCGEIGLVFGGLASATVTCKSQVQLLRLSRKSFDGFCKRHPPFADRLKNLSDERAKINQQSVPQDSRKEQKPIAL